MSDSPLGAGFFQFCERDYRTEKRGSMTVTRGSDGVYWQQWEVKLRMEEGGCQRNDLSSVAG